MKKRILVPYMAATLAMAASISVAARDGAVVARSYMNYNDQKPSVAAEYRYQTVGISWTNTYKIVTAEEARQIQDGIVIFAFPRCPYCRNLITEVTDVAVAEIPQNRLADTMLLRPVYQQVSVTSSSSGGKTQIQTHPGVCLKYKS